MAKTLLGLLAGFFLFSLTVYSQSQLQYNFEYTCNKERMVVGHCRRDSDQPGYPRTTDAENYCMVYYPDRPKQGGFEVQKVELQSDVVKKLRECGAFRSTQSSGSASQTEIDESVVEFHRGEEYYKLKDYAGALAHFKKSNAIAPSSAAYIMSGIMQYFLKQYPDAVLSLKETIRMAPANPEAHYWLGMAYKDLAVNTKDYTIFPKAESEYREAIRLKTDYQAAYRWLGSVLSMQQKNQEALDAFQESLRLNPKDINAKYLMAVAYAKVHQKEEAMRLYRDVAESDPKSAAELLSLITELLDRPAPAASGTAEYALTEGNKLRDKKDYTGAIQWYKKAIALDPTSDVAQLNLGYCYYFLEQYQAALAPLQQIRILASKP